MEATIGNYTVLDSPISHDVLIICLFQLLPDLIRESTFAIFPFPSEDNSTRGGRAAYGAAASRMWVRMSPLTLNSTHVRVKTSWGVVGDKVLEHYKYNKYPALSIDSVERKKKIWNLLFTCFTTFCQKPIQVKFLNHLQATMGSTETATDQTFRNTSTPNLFSLRERTIIGRFL